MYVDSNLKFSDGQLITATAKSTLKVDLKDIRDIGNSKDLWFVFLVLVDFDSAGDAATLNIDLDADDNTSLSSPAIIQTMTPAVIPQATLVAGYKLVRKLQPGAYERYLGLNYTVGTENFTAGKVDAFITDAPQLAKTYPNLH